MSGRVDARGTAGTGASRFGGPAGTGAAGTGASRLGGLVAGLLAGVLTACAGGPEPRPLPSIPPPAEVPAGEVETVPTTAGEVPEPSARTPSPVPAPPMDRPPPSPADPAAGSSPGRAEEAGTGLVVIDQGGAESGAGPSLVEAAQAERERRREAAAPTIVITDKNLDEYATGEITFTPAPPPATGGGGEPGAGPPLAAADPDGAEAYWRGRALAARLALREAADRIAELDERAAELRQEFYAADDAYYRDSRIKPAWDRALAELEETRRAVVARRDDLALVLDEGRRAGALPGWLREGIELEPEPEPAPGPSIHQTLEPPVAGEAGDPEGGR